MNKDRAIQLLERLQDPEPYEPQITSEAFDAIQMAIDALSADGDTISRKKAIEALDKRFDSIPMEQTSEILMLRKDLRNLPPAQPEPSQVAKDIARIVENGQDMRVIGQERIRGHWIIRETSSGDTEARCSHCGFTTLVDEPGNGLHMVSDLNFCPKCGADMREVTT